MTTKTIYIANDGTEFEHEKACTEYERIKAIPKELKTAIKTLADFCEKTECKNCPFYQDHDCFLTGTCPVNWKVGVN